LIINRLWRPVCADDLPFFTEVLNLFFIAVFFSSPVLHNTTQIYGYDKHFLAKISLKTGKCDNYWACQFYENM